MAFCASLALDKHEPWRLALMLTDKTKPFDLKLVFSHTANDVAKPFGSVTHTEPSAEAQQRRRRFHCIVNGAHCLMPRDFIRFAFAFDARTNRLIRRIHRHKVKRAEVEHSFERTQIGIDHVHPVFQSVERKRTLKLSAGSRLYVDRRDISGFFFTPKQRYDATARTEVAKRFFFLRVRKVGKQDCVRAEGVRPAYDDAHIFAERLKLFGFVQFHFHSFPC